MTSAVERAVGGAVTVWRLLVVGGTAGGGALGGGGAPRPGQVTPCAPAGWRSGEPNAPPTDRAGTPPTTFPPKPFSIKLVSNVKPGGQCPWNRSAHGSA